MSGLSLATGVFQIISSVLAVLSAAACGCFAALTFLAADMVPVFFWQVSPEATPFDAVLSMGGYAFIAALAAFALFSVLTIRQARHHLGRRKMLRLYPSQSGLRVYRWPLLLSVVGLVFALALVLAPFVFQGTVLTAFVPFVATFALEIVTWVYYKVNFDKMMKEVG